MKAGTLNMTNCFGVRFLWTPKTYSNCKKKGPYKQAFTFKISLLFNHLLQDLPLKKVTKQQTTDLLQIYQSKKMIYLHYIYTYAIKFNKNIGMCWYKGKRTTENLNKKICNFVQKKRRK